MVTAFLRFIGVSNAAIWLGAVFFCLLEVRPSLFSPEMETLLGAGNSSFFPYLSGAVAQIVWTRCCEFQIVCAGIAWLHALAEWLYLGRPSRRFSFGLLAVLLALAIFGAAWVQPRVKATLRAARHPTVQVAEREAAAKSLRAWQSSSDVLDLAAIGGLLVYLWRVANPKDAARFVSSVKFRG